MKIPESLLLHIILAALFLLAAVIGLMRPLRNRTANFCLFVAGMGLETMLAYRLLSGQWLLPALVSAVFYYGREFLPPSDGTVPPPPMPSVFPSSPAIPVHTWSSSIRSPISSSMAEPVQARRRA